MGAPAADLSANALLGRSIELLRAHPLPLLLPPVLLSLLSGNGGRGNEMDANVWMDPASIDPLTLLPFYALVATIVTAVLVALVVVALVIAIIVVVTALVWTATSRALLDHLDTGAAPDFGAAFRAVNGRWRSLGWTFFLASLLTIVGFILLIVPGFIVLSGLLPLFAVLASEATSGPDAIRRTWDLTKGRKGPLALLVVGGILLEAIVGAILGWIPLLGWLVTGALGGAVTAVWLVAGALVFRAARAAPAAAPVAGPNPS